MHLGHPVFPVILRTAIIAQIMCQIATADFLIAVRGTAGQHTRIGSV
jgi:hypothetical protein